MSNEKNDEMFINLLVRIDKKQDQLQAELVDLKVDSARNTQSLILHMKRSDLLEDLVQHQKEETDKRLDSLELIPKSFNLWVKIIAGLSVVTGAIYTLFKFLG
jgi:hypothetical protein